MNMYLSGGKPEPESNILDMLVLADTFDRILQERLKKLQI